jgi:hypothetical protein
MSLTFVVAIVVVLAIVLLLILARALGRRLPTLPSLPSLPYRRKDTLLTAAERSFYGVLQQATANDLDIFAKVRLIDLIWLPPGTHDRQRHINRVMSKHVDFVLCDPRTSSPLLIIELDDSSHARRRDRDEFVDRVLEGARLPLLRVPAKHGYNPGELSEAIRRSLPDRPGAEAS